MPTWRGVVVAALFSGCSSSHPVLIAGIDPDRPVVGLTDEEWQAFCDWKQSLRDSRAGEFIRYECMDGVMYPSGRCPTPSGCYSVKWTSTTCMDSVLGARMGFREAGDGCLTTVGELAQCAEIQDALSCEPRIPECIATACPP